MGCWNHTCTVTNLPVHEDDEVEVILLQGSRDAASSSFCSSMAYYSPLPLTFSGEYNDYGAVQNCKGVALDIIVDSLRNTLFEMEVGENEYHDIPAKKDIFDVEYMFKLQHDNRLYIHNRTKHHLYDPRDKIIIKHVVVLKDVYDEIVENISYETWSSDGAHDRNIQEFRSEYPKFFADMDEILDYDPLDYEKKHLQFMLHNIVSDTKVGNLLSEKITDGISLLYPINVVDALRTMRREQDKNTESLLDNAIRFHMFNKFMNMSRKTWHVQCGVGSQEDRTQGQELCAKLTLSSIEKMKKRFEELE